ncbi:RNA polymerase sigma factor [Polycladidibacter hongkongensis]|uniref:RNA polymerase sigma factor n=1 Tax=Polycladidibacter hongkongensis TaxID=1647556 RepID=UPI00082CEB9F|nr:sigma-70 family RNA polymerase sigma factor [Pseudovibrio hongkongensis]
MYAAIQRQAAPAPSYSLEQLWRHWSECRPLLMGAALRLCNGDRDAAEDLLSASIVKIANHFVRGGIELREPRAFFLSAVRNEFISQYRKRRVELQVYDPDCDVYADRVAPANADDAPQERLSGDRQVLAMVCESLKSLPTIYREIFVLKFIEDKGYPEISKDLDISQALARKRVQFLRQRLRAQVDGPLRTLFAL